MADGQPETAVGGSGSFPTTIWTFVRSAGDPASADHRPSLDRLLQLYWKPVYVFIRTAWRKSVEDAKDLTQAFFAHLLERDFLARCRPERGGFRSYLKQALRFFLIDAERAAQARRPAAAAASLDIPAADLARLGPATPEESPDRAYDRQWFLGLLDGAVEELRRTLEAEGKEVHFEVFRRCVLDLEPGRPAPTYAEAARSLGLRDTDVRNYLVLCRRALREIVRSRIRQYVPTAADVDEELAEFLRG